MLYPIGIQTFEDIRTGGYVYVDKTELIYNPFSLLNALGSGEIGNYWYATGTPTFLVNILRKFDVPPTEIGNIQSNVAGFASTADQMDDWVPLLYQTGYLTISSYDPGSGLYTLDIPNGKVRTGLFRTIADWRIA